MSNRLLSYLSLLVVIFLGLFSSVNVLAQTISGCPSPLQPWNTGSGVICQMVYTNVSQLLPGCAPASFGTDTERLAYANNVRSVECQPQSGYSVALRGDVLPDGSFRCGLNVGWIAVGTDALGKSIYKWNGGCALNGPGYPIPQPTGGPGVMPDSVDKCDGTEALSSGVTGLSSIRGREACIAYAGMKSCGISTNNSVFDTKFDPGTCCQYGVDPNISLGGVITGCGGSAGAGSTPVGGNGGVSIPWAGGTGSGTNTFGSGNFLSGILNQLGTISTTLKNGTALIDPATGLSITNQANNTALGNTISDLQAMINNYMRRVTGTGTAGSTNGTLVTTVVKPQVTSGLISLSVPVLNVRSAPSITTGVVVSVLMGLEKFNAVGWVVGDSVEGINKWWVDANNHYIWSGGTVEQPSGTALPYTGGTTVEAVTYQIVTLQNIVTSPNSFLLKNIQVSGKLINKGNLANPNFFITDGTNELSVNVWLPLTAMAIPGVTPITTMQTYLDKNVTLKGNLTFLVYVANGIHQLQVSSATIDSTTVTGTTHAFGDQSTKFTVGQKVKTTDNLNVRNIASVTGTSLGIQPIGSSGTIVGGGYWGGTNFWWEVKYDSGVQGYSIEDYLVSN